MKANASLVAVQQLSMRIGLELQVQNAVPPHCDQGIQSRPDPPEWVF
jgi:hypothetical protein